MFTLSGSPPRSEILMMLRRIKCPVILKPGRSPFSGCEALLRNFNPNPLLPSLSPKCCYAMFAPTLCFPAVWSLGSVFHTVLEVVCLYQCASTRKQTSYVVLRNYAIRLSGSVAWCKCVYMETYSFCFGPLWRTLPFHFIISHSSSEVLAQFWFPHLSQIKPWMLSSTGHQYQVA